MRATPEASAIGPCSTTAIGASGESPDFITLAVTDPIHDSNLVAIGGFLGLAIVIALSARAAKR